MNQHSEHRPNLSELAHDERGFAAVMLTIFLPVIVGLFSLATDMSYVHVTRNLLQVSAEAAALAATSQLPDKNLALSYAKQYADKNMPTSMYGAILKDADVIPGKWPTGCVGANCFSPAGAQDCTVFQCNAVKVTTQTSAANGNALKLVFAPLIGLGNFDVGASAIAVAGPGPGSQTTWNVIIVEDISQSFSQQLPNARAADLALLDCIRDNAASGSKLGVTLFTGVSPSSPYQPQIAVSDTSNYNSLKSKIQGINQCSSPGMPGCSGSNVASGMSSAIGQICPGASSCQSAPTSGARQAMVIITDGIPNCSSSIPNCSNNTLLNNAVALANQADAKFIDVFTIYYGNSDSDANWLAGLVRGNGLALKTPDPTKLGGLMLQLCVSSLTRRLVW